MARDRITELRIKGLRSIDELTLDLKGLTVLIGENGSGKSSVLEALEILRRAASQQFYEEFQQIHGGLFGLLRKGASGLELGVKVEGDGPDLSYRIHLAPSATGYVVAGEQLQMESGGEAAMLLVRTRHDTKVARAEKGPMGNVQLRDVQPTGSAELLLPSLASPTEPIPWFGRMKRALEHIEVHVPFEVTASWVARAHERRSDARGFLRPMATSRLTRFASNLPNVFHTLHMEFGGSFWTQTMDLIRLGLGAEVEDVLARLDGSGAISLWLKLRNLDDPIPATSISDGQLAYLAFVALYRLPRPERSILAFDEPDLHLHPDLLVRIVDFFDTLSDDHPVLLATHSDRLLDALMHPAEAVRVCDLVGSPPATRIRKVDHEALKVWLDRYRGLGDIRSEGFLPEIVALKSDK